MEMKISKEYMNQWHITKFSKCATKQIDYERQKIGQLGLGYKKESYFTEEEMMQGYKALSYNQLSIDERILWNESEKLR